MLRYVEASWAYVGPSLASWVQVGGSWTHLGSKLEVCAAILRPCRCILVVSGVQVGGQKFDNGVPGGDSMVFGLHRGVGGNSTNTLLPKSVYQYQISVYEISQPGAPTRGAGGYIYIYIYIHIYIYIYIFMYIYIYIYI